MWSPEPENYRNRHLHTSKIGKLLPFVPQTTDDEATIFLSHMQNFVKIGKELWM